MENDTAEVEREKRGSSGTHSVSRWSPTKEQISILENMYTQGIRTPNAEQIQQITSRLRAYGHIEGKNVFYWFQNHKARQRQKLKQQKQQCIGFSNHFLHASHPIYQNVVCAPYGLQQSGTSFYPQQEKVLATVGISSMCESVMSLRTPRMCDGPQIYEGLQRSVLDCNSSTNNSEALTLFPLHPTGILEEKTTNQVPSHAAIYVDVTDASSANSLGVDQDRRSGNQPFFDFFTLEQVVDHNN